MDVEEVEFDGFREALGSACIVDLSPRSACIYPVLI